MKIGGSDDSPLIPPVNPTPETANLGDHKKPPEERRDDVERFRDRMPASSPGAGEDINLSGISAGDARTLLDADVFKGWAAGKLATYTGELPAGLMQLQNALRQVESGPVPADDQIFLKSAGTLIARSAEEISTRGDANHATSLGAFKQQAQEISTKLARERGPSR